MKMIIAALIWTVAEPAEFSILWVLTGLLIACHLAYEVIKEDF